MSTFSFPSQGSSAEEGEAKPPSGPSPPPQPTRKPYLTHSSRSFSRSAAQRQSVMALPSIAHLQHGFAKLSLAQQAERKEWARGRSVAEMLEGGGEGEGSGERRRGRSARGSLMGLTEGVEGEEGDGLLGPEPEKPVRDDRMPWEKEGLDGGPAVKGEKELRREVVDGFEAVCERWNLNPQFPTSRRSSFRHSLASSTSTSRCPSPLPPSSSSQFLSPSLSSRPLSPSLSAFSDTDDGSSTVISDGTTAVDSAPIPPVLDLLTTTTSAIRAVQRYVVSLPASTFATSTTGTTATASVLGSSDAHNRSTGTDDYLRLSTAARPRTSLALPVSVSSAPSSREAGEGQKKEEEAEILKDLRKKSLEVLGLLREIEALYRLPAHAPAASSSTTGSLAFPPHEEEAEEARTYAPDVSLDKVLVALPNAAQAVEGWVEVVSRVLSVAGGKGSTRSQGRSRRVSTPTLRASGGKVRAEGDEDQTVRNDGTSDEEGASSEEVREVPEWAVEGAFEGDDPALAHSLLLHHLPHLPPPFSALSFSLPNPSSSPAARSDLLNLLASHPSLLCHTYNAVLLHSSHRRAFGFIPEKSIHELPLPSVEAEGAGGEAMSRQSSTMSDGGGEGGKVGRTFRRVENLRVWAGALKFRYSLPLYLPPSSSSMTSSASPSFPASTAPAAPPPPPPGSSLFDPRLVALRQEGTGWEEMLAAALGAWAGRVAREWREEEEGER